MDALNDLVPLSIAAKLIGDDVRVLDVGTLRRAAHRLGVLRTLPKPDGRLAIGRQTVVDFQRSYRTSGYLAPRVPDYRSTRFLRERRTA
jgi:hypothetical protein